MLKNGLPLAFGTDYNVEPISPFRGLYACVTRERPEGGPRNGWEPQEKISLDAYAFARIRRVLHTRSSKKGARAS